MITNTSYCLIMYQTSKHLSHTGRTRSSHCVHKGSRTATRSYRACWDHRATGSEPVGSRPQRPCSLMDADPLELGQQEPRRGCRGPVCTGGHTSSFLPFQHTVVLLRLIQGSYKYHPLLTNSPHST